jgi:hypothetical protein
MWGFEREDYFIYPANWRKRTKTDFNSVCNRDQTANPPKELVNAIGEFVDYCNIQRHH